MNMFGYRRYPKLREIDMSYNEIEIIEEGAFNRMTSLEKLILNNNQISNISLQDNFRVFQHLGNLAELQLSNAFYKNLW